MSENNLVPWARGLAEKVKVTQLTQQAQQAADLLRGRVIQSDEDAAAVTDLVKRVKEGAKHVKGALDTVVAPLKEAADAARAELAGLQATLKEAEEHGKDALTCWRLEKELRERTAQRKADAERVAAEKDAREAAEAGREVPPPPQAPPPPPAAKSVYGSVGQSYTTTRLHAELVDIHEAAAWDPGALTLAESRVCDAYRLAEKREELESAVPHPSGGVVWHGIRFYRVSSTGVK
jgi:hypothetical protein